MQWMQQIFSAKRSNPHSMYDTVTKNGYMVVGTSLVQKGQTHAVCRTQDAVHSGHSGIVVYGGGNIVFGAKWSNKWMQWNSGIWWWEHCLWYKKGQTSGHSGSSGIVVHGGGNIVFGAKRSDQ